MTTLSIDGRLISRAHSIRYKDFMPTEARRDFLFVQSTTEAGGGAEAVLYNLFESSAPLRERSIVASLSFGDGDLPERLRRIGAEVVELPRARLRQPLGVARTVVGLRQLVRARGVRVVIGNGAHPQILGSAGARLAGVRSVFLVHMIHSYPWWKNNPRDALAVKSPCDMLLAVSRASLATMKQLRPKVDSHLLYNGTPIREVTADDARRARGELGAGPDDILLGVFGRLQHWKGQDVFVEAAAAVARRDPLARFAVVGGSSFGLEREFFDGLRRRVAELHLSDRLVFTGFRTDVPRLMAACDVVCHTSRVPEPFGLVVIEAMMQGRPVIATRGGGPSEIIESDADGVLVAPDDPAALAAAMTALIGDPARRRSLGAHGMARARTQFTIDRMASELLGHLDRLLAN
jgi:glycosyltransferase involved in cell wall biosynthesis